jgi:chaperonin cofactor prefoldin
MDIPIEVVRKGEESVNKYIELSERQNKLYNVNSKAFTNFFVQIKNIKKAIKEIEDARLYTANPYFKDKENEWKLPEFETMSKFVDAIWTYQKNLETSLSDLGYGVYDYIKVYEELDKLY